MVIHVALSKKYLGKNPSKLGPGTHVMINGQRWHMHYRITSTSDTIQGHATIEDLGLSVGPGGAPGAVEG